MRLIVALLMGSCFPFWVWAQSCRLVLEGRITDNNSVDALEGAQVLLQPNGAVLFTDAKGRFRFEGVCSGALTLVISHIGCETIVHKMQVYRDTALRFRLDHQEAHLSEVSVVEHRKESHVTQQVDKLEGASLRRLSGLALGDVVKTLPGVTTINYGSSIAKPVIRGLHSNRVLILHNGVRLESQQWGTEHAPEIDPSLAKSVALVKGASALRYGSDAIGGVIMVDAAVPGLKPGISGEVNLSAQSNSADTKLSAMVEGNHEKLPAFGWRLQGGYRAAGNSRAPRYWLKNTGLREGSLSVGASWRKAHYGLEVFYSLFDAKVGIFSGAHVHNLTDLELAIKAPEPRETAAFTFDIGRPYQNIRHHLLKMKANVLTGTAGQLTAVFAYQLNNRTEYDKHKPLGDNDNRPAFQFAIQTMSADLNWQHKPVRGFSGEVGFSGITQTNNYRYGYFIPAFWNFSTGLYALERWVYRKLELEAGLRLDYRWLQTFLPAGRGGAQPVNQWLVPSGSVGFDYHFSDRVKWNVNLATAWRAPQVVELFADGVHHGAASYERGKPDMKAELAYSATTSLELNFKWLEAQLGFYQYLIRNFIYTRPALSPQLTIRGAYPAFNYMQTNASLTGGDAAISIKPYGGIVLFHKISLLRAWDLSRREGLIMMPPQRLEHGIRYTFRDFKTVKGFYIEGAVVIVTRQGFVPAGQDYLPPPDGYWLLNFETGSVFEVNNQSFFISVSVHNALNKSYRDYLNRFRYFTDERGWNATLRFTIPLNNIKTTKNKNYEK